MCQAFAGCCDPICCCRVACWQTRRLLKRLLLCSRTWLARQAWCCSQYQSWTVSWTCELCCDSTASAEALAPCPASVWLTLACLSCACMQLYRPVSAAKRTLAGRLSMLCIVSCLHTVQCCSRHNTAFIDCSCVSSRADCLIAACRSVLQQVVGDFEYFLGILPDGSGLAAPLNPGFKAPIQLGRQVLAQLAGVPER